MIRLLPALNSPTSKSTRAATSWPMCCETIKACRRECEVSARLLRTPLLILAPTLVIPCDILSHLPTSPPPRSSGSSRSPRTSKAKFAQGLREPLLPGRVLALVFEKQSLRTRVSFEAGMAHLGGSSIMLGDDAGFGKRESIADFARVLSEMVDVIVVRSKQHATVDEFAEHSTARSSTA